MTKNELIQHSVEEVRKSAHLYSEFLRIFKEENGKGCTSCKFKQIFSSWQREQNQPKNINTMENNTFILRDSNARYRVNESEILSSKASDEIALKWLSLKSYGGNATNKDNLEKVFKKLPKDYGKDSAPASAPKKEAKETTNK